MTITSTTEASTPQSQEDTMTTPLQQQIDLAATTAAQAAHDLHQLRVQQREHEEHTRANKQAEALARALQTRKTFPQAHNKPIREARDAFEQAVASGENPIPAWIAYNTLIELAADAQRSSEHVIYNHERAQFDAINERVNDLNRVLANINNGFENHKHEYLASREWETVITIDNQTPTLEEVREEVNKALTQLSQEHGNNTHLKADNKEEYSSLALGIEPPKTPRMSIGSRGQWESRTYEQALQQAIDKAITAAAAASRD